MFNASDGTMLTFISKLLPNNYVPLLHTRDADQRLIKGTSQRDADLISTVRIAILMDANQEYVSFYSFIWLYAAVLRCPAGVRSYAQCALGLVRTRTLLFFIVVNVA